MKAKTIFLHIGFGKTGTTAVQSFFSTKRNELLKNNFLYPATGLVGNAHQLLADSVTTSITALYSLYEQLEHEIASSSVDNIIISSEHLAFLKPSIIQGDEFKKIFKEHVVKIIFYVRKQEDLIESAFLQWQRVGDDYCGRVDRFFRLHKNSFDFNKRIAPWAVAFGDAAIVARLYDKRVIGNDICRDICSVIGIQGLEFGPKITANISLRPEFSSLITLIDEAGIEKSKRSKIIDELLHLSEKFDSVKKISILSAELKKEIADYYRKSNQEFSSKYLPPEHSKYLCSDD